MSGGEWRHTHQGGTPGVCLRDQILLDILRIVAHEVDDRGVEECGGVAAMPLLEIGLKIALLHVPAHLVTCDGSEIGARETEVCEKYEV